MIRQISYIAVILVFTAFQLKAEINLDSLLRTVEANNRTLAANAAMTRAMSLEARTGITLQNPSVEYEYMWGSPAALGKSGELTVTQGFDFPTAYFQRSKIADFRSEQYDRTHAAYRQELLLNVKLTAFELIYLYKKKAFLDIRLQNANHLADIYRQRIDKGDANVLEYNKIRLEQLRTQTESRLNDAAIKNALNKLQTFNNGIPITFDAQDYPAQALMQDFESIRSEAVAANPSLRSIESELSAAAKDISLSKSLVLPKFELGYRNDAGRGEQFNGIKAGITIPLFEGKNTVKRAKAQASFVSVKLESERQNYISDLQQFYEQTLALQSSMNEYKQLLESQNNLDLLNKALEFKHISIVEYFVEIQALYLSVDSFQLVERDFYNTLARLYQYKL